MSSSGRARAPRSSRFASAAAWAPPRSSSVSDYETEFLKMNLTNFRFETDADGIALVSWDMPGRSMNVINGEIIDELGQIADKIASDPTIKGAVFTSGKDGFAAGADLTMLETAGKEYARSAKAEGKEAAMRAFVDGTKQLSLVYRRLETC